MLKVICIFITVLEKRLSIKHITGYAIALLTRDQKSRIRPANPQLATDDKAYH